MILTFVINYVNTSNGNGKYDCRSLGWFPRPQALGVREGTRAKEGGARKDEAQMRSVAGMREEP